MRRRDAQTRLSRYSFDPKAFLIVGLFAAIVGALVALAGVELEIQSAVRAYVGGEGLWSKGVKQAVLALHRYAESHDERDYRAFEAALAIPIGGRKARLELEQEDPDLEVAAQGFIEARNHEDDVDSLISLFRRFRGMQYMSHAIALWEQGDYYVLQLRGLGQQLHLEITSGEADPQEIRRLLASIDDADRRVTPLSDAFTQVLAEAARWIKDVLLWIIMAAGLLLMLIGGGLIWVLVGQAREGERRYRNLLNTANDAIVVTDVGTGRIIDANREAGHLFGRPAEELIDLPARDLETGSRMGSGPGRRVGLLREDGAVVELEIQDAHGRAIPVEVSSAPVFLGRRKVVQSILRDITERKKAVAALEASRRRIEEEGRVSQALMRVGHELLALLDAPTLLDHVCKLTAEVIGVDSSQTWLWQPESQVFVARSGYGDTPEQWESARALRLSRSALARFLERLERDGVVALRIDELEPSLGHLAAHLGIRTGIYVALRRGEELIGFQTACLRRNLGAFSALQLRIANGIGQLASMALENSQLVEKLDRANRVKSDFVATMSHELRTPLNIIVGYTGLLLDETFGPLASEQLDTVRRIDRSASELFELINATLDVSRLEAGQVAIDPRDVDLGDFIREVATEVQVPEDKPMLRLSWVVHERVARVRTDPLKLKVVLKNLVRNALKFTEHGKVEVAVSPLEGGVELAVSDTGIGMPEEVQAVIFERFRQGTFAGGRSYGGVGLGLYITQQLVTMLGGRISVESTLGRGSTFRVWLPHGLVAGRHAA